MSDTKLHVFIKDPGKKPRSVNISQRLENLQKTVGGYVEAVRITSDLAILCDEEGRLKKYPRNCAVCNIDFVGTIVFIGTSPYSKSGFTDVPMSWEDFKEGFPNLFEEA